MECVWFGVNLVPLPVVLLRDECSLDRNVRPDRRDHSRIVEAGARGLRVLLRDVVVTDEFEKGALAAAHIGPTTRHVRILRSVFEAYLRWPK